MTQIKRQRRAKRKLYESVDVWKRISEDQLVRYRCFRVSPGAKFCVQSADHFHLPIAEEVKEQHEKQFLELLSEEAPDEREKAYDTLEEAIEMFEKGFEEEFGDMNEFLKAQREK